MSIICSVLTRIALRTGRATGRDDLWSVWQTYGWVAERRVKLNEAQASQLLETTLM